MNDWMGTATIVVLVTTIGFLLWLERRSRPLWLVRAAVAAFALVRLGAPLWQGVAAGALIGLGWELLALLSSRGA